MRERVQKCGLEDMTATPGRVGRVAPRSSHWRGHGWHSRCTMTLATPRPIRWWPRWSRTPPLSIQSLRTIRA